MAEERKRAQPATVLAAVAAAVEQRAGELGALDAAVGDGDHGVTVTVGVRAVMAAVKGWDPPDLGALLERTGMALLDSMGGAAGPLFGAACLQAARVAAGHREANGPLVAAMLEAARDGVMARGKAHRGDKTMVDALAPAAEAARRAAAEGADAVAVLAAAASVAATSAVATRDLPARVGRASRLGDRALGHQDAGATSVAVVLAALRDALALT